MDRKNKVTYTKAELIQMIAKNSKVRLSVVQTVYDKMVSQIEEILSSVDDGKDVSIRLFDGLSLDSTLHPEKEKLNNLTGKVITTKKQVKVKANVTRSYNEKITRLSEAG